MTVSVRFLALGTWLWLSMLLSNPAGATAPTIMARAILNANLINNTGERPNPVVVSSNTVSTQLTAPTALTVVAHPDYAPLADLYNATNGPAWTLKTNWITDPNPCNWYRISCKNNRVTSIGLSSNRLIGTIPASLGNLTNLENIYLDRNQLTGSIPASLGILPKLFALNLSYNQLRGSVPGELGSLINIREFNLRVNQLSGSIPSELGLLTNLSFFSLSANQLTGSIPASLGNLTKLAQLQLSDNQLTGCLPTSLSALCGGNRVIDFSGNPGLPGGGNWAAFCANGAGSCSADGEPFSISGVTTVSCQTITTGLRRVSFSPQYGGLSGQPVSFSVVNEMGATTASGPYTLNVYADNPTITLKSMQSGTPGDATFSYNWLAACNGGVIVPPATSPFSITGVTTVSCQTITTGLRRVSFTPRYAGLSGQPVSFSVVNEMMPTTAAGPYTLNIYTDNPTIMLKAFQSGTASEAIFSYNWLAVCNGNSNGRRGVEPTAGLSVTVLGNPVRNGQVTVEVRGADQQPLLLSLTTMQGQLIDSHRIERAGAVAQHRFEVGRRGGMLLLRVSTPTQEKTVKLLTTD